MNKYYAMLQNVLENGREQHNKKGNTRYLTNEVMRMDAGDLFDIFESHGIARKKLKSELELFCRVERNSKNYVLFLGETNVETNQAPCLSLVQSQIEDGRLLLTTYQRSSDASLGLPSDIYHLYLISRQVDLPLHSITLFLGNVHIYENNI